MSHINKVLIPFDFSEASVNALEYVINFAGPNRVVDIQALYVSAMPVSESEEINLKSNFKKVIDSFSKKVKRAPEITVATGEVIDTILAV
ncbi:MAG: universal stress protein, partial [Flavobacteriaceae bacterium]